LTSEGKILTLTQMNTKTMGNSIDQTIKSQSQGLVGHVITAIP
jgi:hypothetical protein